MALSAQKVWSRTCEDCLTTLKSSVSNAKLQEAYRQVLHLGTHIINGMLVPCHLYIHQLKRVFHFIVPQAPQGQPTVPGLQGRSS